MHREKGQSDRDFFQHEIAGENHRILESHSRAGVCYLAIEQVRGEDAGQVFGAVILTHRAPNSYHNYGYKAMTEDMGPGDYDCPPKILDLLTPTESKYATEWRARCRERATVKANRPSVSKGQRIRFANPLSFTDGRERDTFTFEGYTKFLSADGVRVRIAGWKDRGYEVIA
jgi:hypothetical protein